MNAKTAWMAMAAVTLGLAVAAWGEGPGGGKCGPKGPGGFGGGMRGPGCEMGPGGGHFRGPGESAEVMAARRESRELARRVRMAQSDEEREELMGQLKEKVRAETELVDSLQEKRLDAIEKAATQRIANLRAQLADMREHREEFVEHEVERLVKGRHGDGFKPGMPPPEECGEGEGGMPKPPFEGFKKGHRPGRRPGGPKGHWGRPGPRPEGPEGVPEEGPDGLPEEPPEDAPEGEPEE